MAKMFAPDSILMGCVDKVTDADIDEYKKKSEEISSYRVKQQCDTEDEQKKLIAFQTLKNRVELRTLADYGEVINELLGQLVNWSFMRERDLMYFQLGFHYMCLGNESAKPEAYKAISVINGTRKIDNAILYQVAAMYIYGLGLYAPDSDKPLGNLKSNSGQTSNKIKAMGRYSQRLGFGEDDLYNSGLELFEVRGEHENIIDIRNYIDHFHYYNTGTDKNEKNNFSILDLYSEVFDRFFTYDMKYQKSVIDMFDNILLRHQVIAYSRLETGQKIVAKADVKKRADIRITKLEAAPFTFSFGKKDAQKELKVPAKGKEYLQTLLKILYYPNEAPRACLTVEAAKVKQKDNKEDNMRAGNGNGSRPAKKSFDNKWKSNGKGNGTKNNGKEYDNDTPAYTTGGSSGTSMADLFAKLNIK